MENVCCCRGEDEKGNACGVYVRMFGVLKYAVAGVCGGVWSIGFLTGVTGLGYDVLVEDSVGDTGAVAYDA